MSKRSEDGSVVSSSSSATPNIETRIGSILDGTDQYLVHQCNCQTTNSAGLARAVFDKYPASNTYVTGKARIPGTIDVIKIGVNDRHVVNLYGQCKPGRAKHETRRLEWFHSGLDELATVIETEPANKDRIVSVAFPYEIGCGLAGGKWTDYLRLINEFAEAHKRILRVVIYQLPESTSKDVDSESNSKKSKSSSNEQ